MVIGEKLKNLLETNKDNIISKKLLALKTNKPTWENQIDFIDVAIENPTKISYITENRIERFKVDTGIYEEVLVNKNAILKVKKRYTKLLGRYKNSLKLEGIIGSYIKVSTKSGKHLSFTISEIKYWNKYKRERIKVIRHAFEDEEIRRKFCYMTSPGKFINKINIESTQKELDEFNRIFYKDDVVISMYGVYFMLVKGRDIVRCYNEENYLDSFGTLGNSCMRYSNCEDYFSVYTANPDKVNMLVLFDSKTDKVCGRAIVWKGEDFTFMDRIYTSNCLHEELFKSYASTHGWMYKMQQSSGNSKIYNTITGEQNYIGLSIHINGVDECTSFPYLDTMQYGNFNKGGVTLYNSQGEKHDAIFINTDGSFENNDTATVWSDWESEDIPESEAVYSEILNGYIYESDAVEVAGRGWGHVDDDNIVKIGRYYYHIDDCEYSDHYGEYVHKDKEEVVFAEDIESYIYLSDSVYSTYKNEYYLADNCVFSEYHDTYILTKDAVEHEGDYIHEDEYDEFIASKEEELEEIDN